MQTQAQVYQSRLIRHHLHSTEPNEGTFILTRPNTEGTTTSSASQFYKDIAGTWEIGRTNTSAVLLHILPDGRYALGEADEADETGQAWY